MNYPFQEFFEESAQCVAKEHGWSDAFAKKIAKETYRGLYCKSICKDPFDISVSPMIDQVWHACIFETKQYREMCESCFNGRFIEHSAKGSMDPVQIKRDRMEQCLIIYKSIFGKDEDIPIDCWEPEQEPMSVTRKRPRELIAQETAMMQVFVKTLNGKVLPCQVNSSMLVRTLKDVIAESDDRSVDTMNLVFAGRQLNDNHCLCDYNIRNESTIHLIERLRGC